MSKKLKNNHNIDYIFVRNKLVSYYREQNVFNYSDIISAIENYEPLTENFPKEVLIDRLRDLPSKKNFDSQFTVVRKNIKKRLIQRIKLDNNLYLSIDDYIPNLEELIKLEEDGQGNKYIKIFSTEGFGQLKSLFNKMRR
ncbi:hypothetical protein SAMN05444369_108124 [Capnocytophaga haemolytica]|uniref:Uncharacterized protein n=1 Tax=Capnocytophaga haemolytica TaxID=45243 RepID=A0AAX2H0F2_9FLAO|nr:hypothetical protein [Capnocytophaga haemolytica]AMD84153.1 hypothetical protein AXF12_00525 [Capnocytophaga haemolytica]SFO07994.1 hypothetical protein SAMN05444369_108124 [Capnocytophaga haemolytica]SNV13069.1 Uncharacterised protein [Capnocytophaga haemolytica]